VKAAFSNSVLTEGNTSDPIELAPNHIVLVRVDQHEKSVPRTLEEVRDQIRKKLSAQELGKQAREQADLLYARLQKGETLEQIAAPLKLKVEQQKDVGRNAVNIEQALVAEAFKLPRPEQGKADTAQVALANDAHALIVLDAVKDPDASKFDAKSREAARNQLEQSLGSETVRGFVDSLRKSAKIEIAEDRLQ
jgi:peptidyl-prolyl cis-trans isomerase D